MDSQIGIELRLGVDRQSLPFLAKKKSSVSMMGIPVVIKSCVVQDAQNVKQAPAIYLGYIT
jgi:hypothetical protein